MKLFRFALVAALGTALSACHSLPGTAKKGNPADGTLPDGVKPGDLGAF
jgi:hypothetical protein